MLEVNKLKHIFDIEIAQKYGVNSAILLENLGYWIKQNEANETNFFDGLYWTFNSRRAYKELFPYMSERQINTAFQKLIDDGLIVTGHYNKFAYDRTLWYALTQKGKCILHFDIMEDVKMSNGNSQNVRPIPDINTDINSDINTDINSNARDEFERFWSCYPKKVGKEAARKSFVKVKVPIETLVSAVERQKRSKQWQEENGRFIPNPATWLNQGRWDDEVTAAPQKGVIAQPSSDDIKKSSDQMRRYLQQLKEEA